MAPAQQLPRTTKSLLSARLGGFATWQVIKTSAREETAIQQQSPLSLFLVINPFYMLYIIYYSYIYIYTCIYIYVYNIMCYVSLVSQPDWQAVCSYNFKLTAVCL